MKLFRIAMALALCAGASMWAQGAKRISRTEAMAAAVERAAPEYPAAAKQLKMEGTVEVDAYIGADGRVEKVETVSGNPVLAKAAQTALLNGSSRPRKPGRSPVFRSRSNCRSAGGQS